MSTRPLHILLVEDNPADARLFELLFTERDGSAVTVHRAETLAQALAELAAPNADRGAGSEPGGHPDSPVPRSAFRAPRFDVVLLDLTLPDSQGLDTLRALRALEHARDLPIVVLSGLADENTALSAVREGAQDYLVKGRIDAELLGRAVRYAIERKAAQEARTRAQDALAISEERLRLVTEASTDVVWDWNVVNGEVYWSDRAYKLFGVRADDVRRFDQAVALIHPEDRASFESALRE